MEAAKIELLEQQILRTRGEALATQQALRYVTRFIADDRPDFPAKMDEAMINSESLGLNTTAEEAFVQGFLAVAQRLRFVK